MLIWYLSTILETPQLFSSEIYIFFALGGKMTFLERANPIGQ